jgi:hypothetical protein
VTIAKNKFNVGDWVIKTGGAYSGKTGKIFEIETSDYGKVIHSYGVEFIPDYDIPFGKRYYCMPSLIAPHEGHIKKLELL